MLATIIVQCSNDYAGLTFAVHGTRQETEIFTTLRQIS
jgi:hypothetical protein